MIFNYRKGIFSSNRFSCLQHASYLLGQHLTICYLFQHRQIHVHHHHDLPKVEITQRNWYQHQLVKEHLGEKTLDEKIKSYRPDCFELIGYESHSAIKAPLSN